MQQFIAIVMLLIVICAPFAIWWYTNIVTTGLTLIVVSIVAAIYGKTRKGTPATGNSGLFWYTLAGLYFIIGIGILIADFAMRVYTNG